MKPRQGVWTDEDNELIKVLVAKGASIIRASAALNRNMASVRNQARKLGTPFPRKMAYRKKLQEASQRYEQGNRAQGS